jgi:peptide/nickel transport system substrate-binding protein
MAKPHLHSLRIRLLLVLALALGVSLVCNLAGALAGGNSPSPGGKVTLRVGWTDDPDNLNPFIGIELSSLEIRHLNYDLLFGYDAATLKPVPELAAELPTKENGEISPDGKTVTVKLRQGVKWQDGEPFTARDVAFTYNFIIKNQAWAFTSYTTHVKNVEVIDDHTVRFNLTQPKANFCGMWVPILPEHIWSKIKPSVVLNSYVPKPPVVGTGPFQTVEVQKGRFVKMVANRSYWRGAPKIDEIIFETYENSDNMASDLKGGALDVAWNIPQAQYSALNSTPGLKAIDYVTKGFDDLAFNCYDKPRSLGNPVLRDPRFRHALEYAVDKQKIANVAYLGFATPATSIIQSGYYARDLDYHWEPPADVTCTFDPTKAEQFLDQAGYADTNGDGVHDYKGKPIELRLWARSRSEQGQRAGRLLTAWFRAIGLKIDYQAMDDGVLNDHLYNTKDGVFAPDYDMFLWGWSGDVDPNFILSIFTTSQINGWSDCAWSDPEYDKLYLQQQTTIDPQNRLQIIYQMEQLVYEQSPYIVLVYPHDLEAYNVAKWDGWVQSPEGKGGVIYTADNIDTYLFVHPKTAAAAGGGGGSNTGLIAGIVIVVVVVIGIVVWLMRRGRGGPVEEV